MTSWIRKTALAGAAVVAFGVGDMVSAIPASANVLTFDFNVDKCGSGCGLLDYGTVTLTDVVGGGVSVDISLIGGSGFVGTGALGNYSLLFNLNPSWTSLSVTGLPSDTGTDTFEAPSYISPADDPSGKGFGSFDWGVECVKDSNSKSCGGSSPHQPLDFVIDAGNAGFTTAAFIMGSGADNTNNVWFAGDISGPTGSTGAIGATPNIDPVPEPITLLLFGTGLIGLSALRRRAKKAA